MAKSKSLTQYEIDAIEENDIGICRDGHWDNFLLDHGLVQLREYVVLLRKIGAKECLAVIEELIAWVDAELQPDMSQLTITDKDPGRLESLWQRYSEASLREEPQERARKLAPPPPKNKMPTTDREYYDFFGPENAEKTCRSPNCSRGTVQFSVFCRTHHFESVMRKVCPWTD
jgi:hypothetical protein